MQSELFATASYGDATEMVLRVSVSQADALNLVGFGYRVATPMLVWFLRTVRTKGCTPNSGDLALMHVLIGHGGTISHARAIAAQTELDSLCVDPHLIKVWMDRLFPRKPPPRRNSSEQQGFRSALIAEQGGCVVRLTMHTPALEGAHIQAWSESHDFSQTNGLLLSCTIHTGHDQGWLHFDGQGRLWMHPYITRDDFQRAYAIPVEFVQINPELLVPNRVERLKREFRRWTNTLPSAPVPWIS